MMAHSLFMIAPLKSNTTVIKMSLSLHPGERRADGKCIVVGNSFTEIIKDLATNGPGVGQQDKGRKDAFYQQEVFLAKAEKEANDAFSHGILAAGENLQARLESMTRVAQRAVIHTTSRDWILTHVTEYFGVPAYEMVFGRNSTTTHPQDTYFVVGGRPFETRKMAKYWAAQYAREVVKPGAKVTGAVEAADRGLNVWCHKKHGLILDETYIVVI